MTEEQKVAELLKPRYKIIDDYPGLKIPVGAILIPNRLDWTINNEWVTPDKSDRKNLYGYDLSKYPHLFKKLEWWQDIKPEDLPIYLKVIETGEICKVTRYFIDGRRPVFYTGETYKSKRWGVQEEPFNLSACVPATAAEYTSYLTSKQVK